ncbi:MAG: EH signature domain-containing protein [Pseudomonadota bacterium]|nr:EH signature domain-containing protein [Pseudomonadota bacterium]
MSDIYDLLKINREFLGNFGVLGKHVVDHPHDLAFSQCLRELEKIRDSIDQGNSVPHFSLSADAVLAKAVRAAGGSQEDFSWQELRVLSWNLARTDDSTFEFVLGLLEDNWRNLFISGLAFYVLNSWNEMGQERRDKACSLIKAKLAAYDGPIRKYRCLKEHADYFDSAGPLRLAKLILVRGMAITDAPGVLGYGPSAITQSFYSDVILNWIKAQKDVSPERASGILQLHKNDRTSKLVFAYLVENAESSHDQARQKALCSAVKRILGDVTLKATWAAFPGATEEHKRQLEHARVLVNKWLAGIFIRVFFEICVQNQDRKRYWLRFVEPVNFVDGFRVAGSGSVWAKLMSSPDPVIRENMDSVFIRTRSGSKDTAALVMHIRDKVFIEFSDLGALYVYDYAGRWAYSLRKAEQYRYVDAIDDLKNPSLPSIVETSSPYSATFRDEGKLYHIGYWESRLENWMRRFFASRGMGFPPV